MRVGWKLIDPAFRYDPSGAKISTNKHNSTHYNERSSEAWEVSAGAFVPGLGIHNPHRNELQENRGIEIGSNFESAYSVGLAGAELNNFDVPTKPDSLNNNNNPWAGLLHRRAVNLLYEGMPYLSLLDYDLLSIKKILAWEKRTYNSVYQDITAADQIALNATYDRWD